MRAMILGILLMFTSPVIAAEEPLMKITKLTTQDAQKLRMTANMVNRELVECQVNIGFMIKQLNQFIAVYALLGNTSPPEKAVELSNKLRKDLIYIDTELLPTVRKAMVGGGMTLNDIGRREYMYTVLMMDGFNKAMNQMADNDKYQFLNIQISIVDGCVKSAESFVGMYFELPMMEPITEE